MIQIEIIASGSLSDLQFLANNWLQNHQRLDIISIKHSAVGTAVNEDIAQVYIILIQYKLE